MYFVYQNNYYTQQYAEMLHTNIAMTGLTVVISLINIITVMSSQINLLAIGKECVIEARAKNFAHWLNWNDEQPGI